LRFRQDINALRGAAVILVVVFHFFPTILSNGYLGVDVFFIISGFLISLGILKDVEHAEFSYADFYKRRVHRIIPAVMLMLVFVTVFEFFILLPRDLVGYSSSLNATLLFSANIYFFFTGGYFGGNDAIKPLLHMWSLGIEEQFYILFPVCIILCISFIKKAGLLFAFLVCVLISSYLLNMYMISIGGDNPAFFLLPTRLWQFLVGVVAAYLLYKNKEKPFDIKYLSIFGIVLIFYNIFNVNDSIPDATILSVGVFIIIVNSLYVPENSYTKALSFFGRISFSLYIWHWPIAAFLNYFNIGGVELYQSFLGLFLSVIISYLSWRYVEERFRKPVKTKRLLICIGFIYMTLLSSSFIVYKSSGFPNRYSSNINEISMAIDSNFRCPKLGSFLYGGSKACIIEAQGDAQPKTAILGNSHSLMYAPAIFDALNSSVLVVPLNGCTPTYDINLNTLCLIQFSRNLSMLSEDKRIAKVIVGTTWSHSSMINSSNDEIKVNPSIFNASMLKTIDFLRSHGKEVYLIGPILTPSSGNNIASDLSRSLAFNANSDAIEQNQPLDNFMSKYSESINFWRINLADKFIPTYSSLCDSRLCYFRKNSDTYFADDNHLSRKGVDETKKIFITSLKN
jgi:peptidoglycan/LPS O-acetylase OafA/YrhL